MVSLRGANSCLFTKGVSSLFLLVISFILSGCATGNSPTVFRTFSTEAGQSISIDAQQRTILVNRVQENGVSRVIFCAEPSPDSLTAFGASTGGKANLSSGPERQASLELATTLANAASDALSTRNATIQLLRDGLYRACEAYASGAFSPLEYAEVTSRYQQMMLSLLSIELVTNLNRPRREATIVAGNGRASIKSDAPEPNSKNDASKKQEKQTESDALSKRAMFLPVADKLEGSSNQPSSEERIGTFYSDHGIEVIAGMTEKLAGKTMESEDRIGQCFRYMSNAADKRASQLVAEKVNTSVQGGKPSGEALQRSEARAERIETLCTTLIESQFNKLDANRQINEKK